ncbi:MAG: EpsG family protein, partial [Eubacteriales bacterium]|nr:EpsG family protein [Eubacteriales bacterium]
MTVVLYFGTMLLNFYCLLMKKKARALDIWSLIFFGMIFAGNIRDGNCDLGRYRFHYLQGTSSVESDIWHVEKGYGYLADAFSHFGIPFQLFLLVIFVVCAFLIFQLMREFECSYSVFFFLYGFFYFFFTLEVLRFFIAVSLLMLGIKFLLKNRWLRFILCVLTASLISISYPLYRMGWKWHR